MALRSVCGGAHFGWLVPRRWLLVATLLGTGSVVEARHLVPERTAEAWTFDGWGTSLCWFGHAVGRWPDRERTAVADALFTPQGLGLTVVRYNIGGGDQPGHQHMPWFRQMEGFQEADGRWNPDADLGQRWMLQAARQRGAQQFEAFSNSPPWWMTRSGCASGAVAATDNNLVEGGEDAFAHYLVRVIKHLRVHDHIEFQTLDPMNEPFTDYWRAGHNQEGCRFSPDAQRKLLQTLRRVLDQEGLAALQISASDETNYTRAIEVWRSYDDATRACVGQVNAHAYDTAKRTELRELIAQAGKPLVMSEVDGAGHNRHDHESLPAAMSLAGGIIDDLRDLRPLRWIFWQAVEDEGGQQRSNNNWGLIHADLAGSSHRWDLTKKYHMMAQFSRHLRPGSLMLPLADPDSVCGWHEASGHLVFVLRNRAEHTETARIDLSRFAVAVRSVEVFRTSETENHLALTDGPWRDGHLEWALPAQSVTTLVLRTR